MLVLSRRLQERLLIGSDIAITLTDIAGDTAHFAVTRYDAVVATHALNVDGVLKIDDVMMTLLEIRGRQVRVGIDAPKEVVILRAELTQLNAEPARKQRLFGRFKLKKFRNV